jgi:hypothetical protein
MNEEVVCTVIGDMQFPVTIFPAPSLALVTSSMVAFPYTVDDADSAQLPPETRNRDKLHPRGAQDVST